MGDGMTGIARIMLRQYLSAHEEVLAEIERSTGKRPAPYKDLEEKVLVALFEALEKEADQNGLDFMAGLLSSLIVDQALPNANHRTALYFVGAMLKQHGLEIDTVLHAHTLREYFRDSKYILERAKKNCKEQHLDLTRKVLVKILGSAQSGKLGNILAYSFMNSFAASSKDLTGSAMD
jgi:prophage maintenance system killer protein